MDQSSPSQNQDNQGSEPKIKQPAAQVATTRANPVTGDSSSPIVSSSTRLNAAQTFVPFSSNTIKSDAVDTIKCEDKYQAKKKESQSTSGVENIVDSASWVDIKSDIEEPTGERKSSDRSVVGTSWERVQFNTGFTHSDIDKSKETTSLENKIFDCGATGLGQTSFKSETSETEENKDKVPITDINGISVNGETPEPRNTKTEEDNSVTSSTSIPQSTDRMADSRTVRDFQLREFKDTDKTKEMEKFFKSVAKKKRGKNILVIGTPGVGKSSFINSSIAAINGKFQPFAHAGLQGEGTSNVTILLKRYIAKDYLDEESVKQEGIDLDAFPAFIDCMGLDDNLSNRLIKEIQRTSDDPSASSESSDATEPIFEELEESVNSVLLEFILRGRIPSLSNLLEIGRCIINGQREQLDNLEELKEKEELKVDAVIFIIARGCTNLPKKLLKSVKQETQRKDLSIPVFGIMTKMDASGNPPNDWKALQREFRGELGIDGSHFIPLVNYVYDDLQDDVPEVSPAIDVSILKILNQIYFVKAEKVVMIGDLLQKKQLEEEKKQRSMGCVAYLVLAVIVLLLLAVIGFVVYSKFKTSGVQPVQPGESTKQEL